METMAQTPLKSPLVQGGRWLLPQRQSACNMDVVGLLDHSTTVTYLRRRL